VHVRARRDRVELLRAADLADPFVERAARDQQPAVIVQRAGLVRIEADGSAVALLGRIPIPRAPELVHGRA
jgi:hypothetical protein